MSRVEVQVDGPRPRFVVPVQGGRAEPARSTGGADPRPAGPGPRPAAPRAGDQRFRAAFEQAPVGMGLSGPEGPFTEVNPCLHGVLVAAGIDPARCGPADLARHAPAADAEAWCRELVAVAGGLVPSARADLPLGPAPGRERLRVTVSAVAVGDARQLLTHLEEAVDRRRPATDPG